MGSCEITERIREECERLRATLETKNAAYGNTASRAPILAPNLDPATALFVRMSDKISRLQSLIGGADANDESLDDTIRDLAGYCVLYLANKDTKGTQT